MILNKGPWNINTIKEILIKQLIGH
jgi:hypothetical protein